MIPGDLAKIDQHIALLVDVLVPLWRQIFLRCITEGFDKEQAMDLLKIYISSQRNP